MLANCSVRPFPSGPNVEKNRPQLTRFSCTRTTLVPTWTLHPYANDDFALGPNGSGSIADCRGEESPSGSRKRRHGVSVVLSFDSQWLPGTTSYVVMFSLGELPKTGDSGLVIPFSTVHLISLFITQAIRFKAGGARGMQGDACQCARADCTG